MDLNTIPDIRLRIAIATIVAEMRTEGDAALDVYAMRIERELAREVELG